MPQISMNVSLTQQLSTNLIQQLSLLQLSSMELAELIEQKTLENPLIQLEDTYSNSYKFDAFISREAIDFSRIAQKKGVTKDFLIEQIPFYLNTKQRNFLLYVIDCLCEKLFLSIPKEELAAQHEMELIECEELLQIVRTFEPIGVGARDVTDYLIMQIEDDFAAPEFAAHFIQFEMEAIAQNDFKKLANKYSISTDEVKRIVSYIKTLKRMPAITIEDEVPVIIPDVAIFKMGEEWVKTFVDRQFPKIQLHEDYVRQLKSEDPSYLKQCLSDYQTLVQGIQFRKKTLNDLVDYIIANQKAFLEGGLKQLKPVTMREVADVLNVHESTISRAVKGKYLSLPFGVIAMNALFCKAVGEKSVRNVHDEIKDLIEQEPKAKPYSDQQLSILLKEKGIVISRRTVMKYREQLNIPSSQKRMYM
jgi:RNA polymerase sigma-54 factor